MTLIDPRSIRLVLSIDSCRNLVHLFLEGSGLENAVATFRADTPEHTLAICALFPNAEIHDQRS